MRREFKDAGSLDANGRNAESGKVLNYVNDFVVFIQIDQIEGEEYAQSVYALRRHDPQAFIELESKLSDESLEASKGRIRWHHT